ncbi:MAG: hypothetical protein M1820_008954 [Bogoriella megaspora]|nr:MAG: hypothetical protein M1820_008954 [Bogoriella megaspora]
MDVSNANGQKSRYAAEFIRSYVVPLSLESCDERKPSCSHFKRFQSRCSFLTAPLTTLPAADLEPRPLKTSPRPLDVDYDDGCNAPKPVEGLLTLEVNNLELLHFYATTTSFTLSDHPELQKIWQQVVPRIAFTHHFLLHAILAFSALHLARVQPERKISLYNEASVHHSTGLKMFRSIMPNISQENCDACFAFSSIITAYAWASSNQTGKLFFSDSSAPEEEFTVEWVSLLRGVHALLKAAGQWMMDGPMKSLLKPRHIDLESARALDPEASTMLTALRQLWESPHANIDNEDKAALDESLILLQEAYGLIASSSVDVDIDNILVVYGWPIQVPEAFLAMVKEQKSEALVLLAYYSLLLNKVDHLWYMNGMSRSLLRSIHNKIGEEWESWMSWPLKNLVLTEFKNQDHGKTGDF